VRKDGLAIQIVRPCASLHRVQIGSGGHQSGAVMVLHHDATETADDHRPIVIASDRTSVMEDADRDPLAGRHGKISG
jgi:hypothetical protein